jgi:nucleoside-diphosphate-sugar epimerase
VHLAGYYDFEYTDNPEYEKTNVEGTNNILELGKQLGIRHFIFSSSITVYKFNENGVKLTEKSPANATFAYAASKIKAEEMMKSYATFFKCSVVRFAAVFSDWCEFPPLYKFLSIWLSGQWDSRLLAGKGLSAMTYIHITDLDKFIIALINAYRDLQPYDIFLASPDGCLSHLDLYHHATRGYFGQTLKPLLISKRLTFQGLIVKQLLGSLHLTAKSFEKMWMLKYIDMTLDIDASYTRRTIGWEPTPRYHLLRRMIFLLEKMKGHPAEWHIRNEAALKTTAYRPNLKIYEVLDAEKMIILDMIINEINKKSNVKRFTSYLKMDIMDLHRVLNNFYHLLMAVVRTGDQSLMLRYIDDITLQRFAERFDKDEIINIMILIDGIVSSELYQSNELKGLEQEIYDYISLTVQLACDEIEDTYENLAHTLSHYTISGTPLLFDQRKSAEVIKKLSVFYQDSTGKNADSGTLPFGD